ncbi:MAG: methionine--tRNA ligase [Candidatus Woesebacteria bacterium]|jgi:methionine--tRNA ligase beta chain
MVTFKDFKKLDIRIGTVVKAQVPDWSHWVIELDVDLGSDIGRRTVFAGLLGFYEAKDLEGRQFPFVVNLEPKKIGPKGDMSEGMMLAASMKLNEPVVIADEETDEKPILLTPSEKVPPGTKIR